MSYDEKSVPLKIATLQFYSGSHITCERIAFNVTKLGHLRTAKFLF